MTNNNVIRLAQAAQAAVTAQPNPLPSQDAALFAEMVQAYQNRRCGALRHLKKSVEQDLRVVHEFLAFSGKPPWRWTEDDFDKWCAEIGVERKLVRATQRKYQGAIRDFLGYLVDNVRFKDVVRQQYGVSLTQICHADNCIPHKVERELSREKPAFTHAQIEQFFSAYDRAIVEADRFAAKDFRPLQRDKVMFFLTYVGGLRASETLGLGRHSFQPNPAFPEFGQFGFISVWGKGSRGSGPRQRTVPVTHALLPVVLEWYLKNVRPHFLRHAGPNEEALFLSERGRRPTLSTFEGRFKKGLLLAGLEGLGFTPHSLRHASSTHEEGRFSLEMIRRKLGHTYAATTQQYMHVPDPLVRDEINRAISTQLDSIREKEDR